MLRKIRIAVEMIFLLLIFILFLGIVTAPHLTWLAHIQLVPALLAGHFVTVAVILLVTLVTGRVYCSSICPLGATNDVIGRILRPKKKQRMKNGYSKSYAIVRIPVFVLFALLLVFGAVSLAGLISPYSIFGRLIALATAPSSTANVIAGIVTLVVIVSFAYFGTRAWCNTVCPVGTFLGFISKFSLFRVKFKDDKCVECGLCSRACKCSCIDFKNHKIDASRCVLCFDCVSACHNDAMTYGPVLPKSKKDAARTEADGAGRRNFLSTAALMTLSAAAGKLALAQEGDGGLAPIIPKKSPGRDSQIIPPGAKSFKNMADKCTACQLCVSACPSHILRPATDLVSLMEPRLNYEYGYCRPECNVCSQVCPTHAIENITVEQKSSISIGHAVWIKDLCLSAIGEAQCDNCSYHCPSGAIIMVPLSVEEPDSRFVPSIDTDLCIVCCACENLCPARPVSAIHVEGHKTHINLD